MTPTIEQLLNAISTFPFCKFRITCQFEEHVQLPSYKGSTFHGGFGWALKQTSEVLYHEIFEAKNAQGHTLMKPFVLTPPLAATRNYSRNDLFTFDLTLFGKHANNAQQVLVALFTWQQLGLGSSRAKFQIKSIDLTLDGTKLRIFQKHLKPLLMPKSHYLGEQLQHKLAQQKIEIKKDTLVFIEASSPINLQKKGQLQKIAPPLDNLLWAIAHRLAGLIHTFGNKSNAAIQQLLPQHIVSCLQHDASIFKNIERYSKNQKQTHQLGGIQGSWCYKINNADIVTWLMLGELINIGNKTSFGFGAFTLALGFEQP